MRIVLILLIGIHGVIHLFGFLQAFDMLEFNAISQPISKPFGIIWLLSSILFLVSLFLLLTQSNYWWIIGILAILLSQFLIITCWKDAKFGTVLNLALLIAVLLAFFTFNFQSKIHTEIEQMLSGTNSPKKKIVTEQMLVNLPFPVRNWLLTSEIIGKETIQSVYLEQDLKMLMKVEQKDFINAKAEQYFTTQPPAFNWSVSLNTNPLTHIAGRDKFENGQGDMIIKVFSAFSVVNEKNDAKLNQATLQRYLAEIVWFPSAVLNSYITWEKINDTSAKATMELNGTKGSGVFHFDEKGNFKKFVAMRFKEVKDEEPTEWTVTATKTELLNGIKIPVELKVDWKLENAEWTWLKLKVTDIKYNL